MSIEINPFCFCEVEGLMTPSESLAQQYEKHKYWMHVFIRTRLLKSIVYFSFFLSARQLF